MGKIKIIIILIIPIALWILLPSILVPPFSDYFWIVYPLTLLYLAPFWYKWEQPNISKIKYYVIVVSFIVLFITIGLTVMA